MTHQRKLRIFVIITLTYWLILFTLTHIPGPDLPDFKVSDKLIHFTAYGLLAMSVLATLNLIWPKSRINESLTIALLLIYGGIDEQTQPYFHRACDIRDWLADAAGVATAVGLLGLIWGMVRLKKPRTTTPAEPVESASV